MRLFSTDKKSGLENFPISRFRFFVYAYQIFLFILPAHLTQKCRVSFLIITTDFIKIKILFSLDNIYPFSNH